MALPVILVDSATGSDMQASGAGPTTALFGTTDASTDGAGTTVTLTAGTDLTNVATDGSHVIFLNDSTAGNRNFGKITGKAGSGGATPTVTVSNAFGISLSGKSWAIGGKRASIGSTTSSKLLDNNGAAGDAKPGWIIEMKSGHSEVFTVRLNFRCPGDLTNGPIIVRGEAGAATLPKIRVQASDQGFVFRDNCQVLQNMELSAETAVSSAINSASGSDCRCVGIKLSRTSSNTFGTGFTAGSISVFDSYINYCTTGIDASDGAMISGNTITGCTTGITSGSGGGIAIMYNVITGNTTGIDDSYTGTGNRHTEIIANTIDGNSGDGLKLSGALSFGPGCLSVYNNQLTNNGGYGLNFSDAGSTDAAIAAMNIQIRNNNTYNNTSGAYKSATSGYAYNACPWASGDPGLNPSYTGGGNYTPTNTSLAGTAYPTSIP